MVINFNALKVAAVFASLFAISQPANADGSLIGHSVKVTTINGAQSRHFGRPYAWISNDKVVLARYNGAHGNWDNYLVVRTVSTGKETPLAKLTKLFVGDGAGLTEYLAVSTDKRWLMWFNGSEDSAVGGVYGGELNGSRIFKHPYLSYLSAVSIPGDDSWMAFLSGNDSSINRASIYDMRTGALKTLKFPRPIDIYDNIRLTRTDGQLFLYAMLIPHSTAAAMYVVKYRVDNRITELGRKAVMPPKNAMEDIYISPDCKSIAWTVQGDKPQTLEIIVTDIDGNHPHSLGDIVNPVDDESGSWRMTLAWLPDSRHISYVYHNALYVVPAE